MESSYHFIKCQSLHKELVEAFMATAGDDATKQIKDLLRLEKLMEANFPNHLKNNKDRRAGRLFHGIYPLT